MGAVLRVLVKVGIAAVSLLAGVGIEELTDDVAAVTGSGTKGGKAVAFSFGMVAVLLALLVFVITIMFRPKLRKKIFGK